MLSFVPLLQVSAAGQCHHLQKEKCLVSPCAQGMTLGQSGALFALLLLPSLGFHRALLFLAVSRILPYACSPLTSDSRLGSSGRTFYPLPQPSFHFVVLISFRPLVFTDSASHDLGLASLHPVSVTPEPRQSPPPCSGL